jgi:hypothetical protein
MIMTTVERERTVFGCWKGRLFRQHYRVIDLSNAPNLSLGYAKLWNEKRPKVTDPRMLLCIVHCFA